MAKSIQSRLSWSRLFVESLLAAYAYVFMEWLFFATKPSFMDVMPFGKKLEVFLLTGFVLAVLVLAPLAVLRILGWIPGPSKRWQVFLFVGAAFPALLAAALSLLLIDNFTYTIFRFGIVTSGGLVRGACAALAVFLLAVWYRKVLHGMGAGEGAWRRVQSWLAVGLLAGSLGLGLLRAAQAAGPAGEENPVLQRQPHIILLGGDGVVANSMSLYGYSRDTTPRLRQLAETGLLAENNFANAAHSTGSVFSMLTGKYPADTRLLYSPNILQGPDAYEHLPGILQRAGYTTVEITFPYYLDAYTVNMQDSFDQVNGDSVDQDGIARLARRFHFEDVGYFLPSLSGRIFDRLLHIFYIRTMPDPYHQVLQPVDPNTVPMMSDEARIRQLIHLLHEADRPLFVHVHLMNTHGPRFYPRRQVFSAGVSQDRDWMTSYYDDAVLDFDTYVGGLLDAIANNRLMDQTVIVIYSDHADQWRTDDKLPLLLHFPGGEFAGRISANTQNLDVAPTLLDYLGMETPGWMAGQSLLHGEPERARPIISVGVIGVQCEGPDWWCVVDPLKVRPPFYQFGYVQAVICQKMYVLELGSERWSETQVVGSTARCGPEELPSRAQVRGIMLEHLRSNGFDVSSLE